MFFGCCLNICAHFAILRESFKGDKRKFIEDHKTVLKLADKLVKIFVPVILVQFFVTSMLLCVNGFQLVMFNDFAQRAKSLLFGFTIILQLFIYSYGGQLIMDESSRVAENIYQIDRDLVIVIARAQRPSVVKAGFFYANLPNYQAILSSTASLITLLQSFLE